MERDDTYSGNEKGDWVRYFADVLKYLPDDGVDGFALHTYTHDLNPDQISGDFLHTTPGYRHLRNEFRTYRDYMNAMPDRFRHLPVFITETDPTTRGQGWNPGKNIGWAQAAYREIGVWNSDPTHQPILSLILYRWPLLRDQPEWAISTRPGIIEDFRQALRASPAEEFKLRMPSDPAPVVVHEPGTLLPVDKQWHGLIVAPLGLNLRTGPSTQHLVIQILPDETAVKVLAEVDEWLYVSALGKTGYIARDFVLRHKPGEGEDPGEERDFLRDDEELMTAPLAPPKSQQIVIDPETATWTEIAVANTWNRYGALIARLCKLLDIDLAVAVAVLAVESGGDAFGPDGRMTIRFENHIFFDLWGKLDPERFSEHFRFELERPWNGHQWRPEPDDLWRDFHGDHGAEWEVFNTARTLFNPQAAKQAISMGAPQIMGFNYSKIGYDNVDAMFFTFQNSENSQIIGFFDFVLADPLRLDALRNGDFITFAASYNGGGQASLYASLIEDAARTFRRLIAEVGPDAHSRPPVVSLPLPKVPLTLAASDPKLYEAWREHIVRGFRNNEKMFEQILNAFMKPYRTTVRMYQILFAVGIMAFVAAVGLSAWTQEALFALFFGGISLSTFAAIFFSRPLRSLEENLNFITWLGVIYNSYWARILYALNVETVQQDLEDITDDFVNQIERLLDKSRAMNKDRSD